MNCGNSDNMLDKQQALDLLLKQAVCTRKTKPVDLKNCLNKILAQDVKSTINVPDFANSAMDGYAVAIDKTTKLPISFNISDRITAGTRGSFLKPGNAARIFTGAPIPENTYAVLIQEECELSNDGKKISINRQIQEQENIRPKANDIKQGELILAKGTKLKPQHIALAASVGLAQLEVFEPIKVGVFFTGNELIPPGQKLTAGKIYNSNRYSIIAMLQSIDCEIVDLGIIADDFTASCDAMLELARQCDLIITTGGVSVGEEDHIKAAVEKLGQLSLWKIKIKPGKPLAFGRIEQVPFFGLPGNPVSAIVTYLLFVLPFINKMQGNNLLAPQPIKVQTDFSWARPKPRREYVRVRIDNNSVPPLATLYTKLGSDVLSSIVWADGLVEVPENSRFSAGEILDYYPYFL